jgi:outer membrane protein insertion porin family
MVKSLINFFIIIKFIFFINILIPLANAQSNIYDIKKVVVNGERRLSESFILNFFPNYPDTIFSDEILNEFTKNLYKTGYFSLVNFNIKGDNLIIDVEEFPLINQITFSGNDLIEKDQLEKVISIKTRDVFSVDNLDQAVDKIRTEYQKIGRYLAEIKIKKNELSEGRIDIHFDINEDKLLVVKNINFIGNKNFTNRELRSKISTKEDAWYKLFGSNKFIPERLEYDKDKLKKFYNERGFIDFRVISAKGELLPDISGFNINFLIFEGERFVINELDFISSSIKDINKNFLIDKISLKKNDYFDSRALEETTNFLINFFKEKGFNFINVVPSIQKDSNLVNISFSITEGEPKYINRINITGNTRTNDVVIRRELSLFEGDPFNRLKLDNSISALKRLGYFETVNYSLNNISYNKVDVNIDVKEVNTGSVSFGVGYSSLNNTSFSFGLREKNFLGEGKKVNFLANLSDKKSTYNIGITEPYFMDRSLALSGNIFNENSENSKGDVKFTAKGLGFGIGFKSNNLSQNFDYNFLTSKSTTSATSTAASETGEEGLEIITSSISHTIVKDTTNSFFNPNSGNRLKISNTLAGIGGDASFIKSVINYRHYVPLNYGDYILAFKSGAGTISSLDKKITSSNRFVIGGRTLRGFDNNGIGPRDTGNNQAVGGNNFYNFSFEIKSDEWMPDDTGLEWLLFTDIGSLWGTDFEANVRGVNDISPRITNGFGLSMITPVGPLQLLWGFPVSSKNYDIEENFQFSIGTNF